MFTSSELSTRPAHTALGKLSLEIKFTRREYQIISLLETSYNYQQLSKKLSISESTLRFHLRNIYRKLKVCNRSGAIAKARALGLPTCNLPPIQS